MNEFFATLSSLPTSCYWKQWFIGTVFALLSIPAVLILSHGNTMLAAALFGFTGLNTLLYPYAHFVQETMAQSWSRNSTQSDTSGNVQSTDGASGDDSIAGAILTFILEMMVIALLYLSLQVVLRYIFWLLGLPLLPVAASLIRRHPLPESVAAK
jgi:hypothetical protein